jgi:hypothetical protein
MRMWAKGAAGATLLTASFVALGAGPVLADVTNGDGSILGGNQINAPISVPVNVSGNSVAVIGRSLAGSTGGSSVRTMGGEGGGFHGRTSGRHSIGGGNQVHAPINAPVDVCGNAVAVVGHALGSCGADNGGDDCITPSSAPVTGPVGGLPQLPVDPASLRTGAMPVAMGATPALPKLPTDLLGRSITPQSAGQNPLGGGLQVPVIGGPPKQLPPLNLAAAQSPVGSPVGSQNGALVALVLGGVFAASAGTVTLARRFTGRR